MSDASNFGNRSDYLQIEPEPWSSWWAEQYGTPTELFDDYSFWQRGKYTIWVAAADIQPGAVSPVDGIGIPLLRTGRDVWKPTSVAVIHFGRDVARNVVDLEADEASRFLGREAIEFENDARAVLPHRGYVIARYLGVPIGCGLWRRGGLASSVPKGRAMRDLELPRA
ncbi:MAG: hypothetical protein GKS06_13425 [Acidobacteria bacterium]|nr:hypothetical protein [Acidobacteriota bacterium]